MKLFVTEIQAICPITDELLVWAGPHIPGLNWEDAEFYCQHNGLGYCKIVGELEAEIPCYENSFEPNWKEMIDYKKLNLN